MVSPVVSATRVSALRFHPSPGSGALAGSGKAVDLGAVLVVAGVDGTSEAPVGKHQEVVASGVTATRSTGGTAGTDAPGGEVFEILQLFDVQFHVRNVLFVNRSFTRTTRTGGPVL